MFAYFDNSATTKPCPEAVEAVTRAMTEDWGNPSSLHDLGIAAHRRLQAARLSVARALGSEPDRVFFTSGGTEADNWAVFSAAQKLGKRGKHLISTQIEHHAILHPLRELEAALEALGELNGKTVREDITNRIFARFCVGK